MSREGRGPQRGFAGATVWITGLPASGKSTLAAVVAARLVEAGRAAYVLDGDDLRCGLCCDLGFGAEDRDENVRRVSEVARMFGAAGVVALVALVSPFRLARERARELHDREGVRFLEVFVNTPLEECAQRDPKGLYRRARADELVGLTGVDAPYEPPRRPELEVLPGTTTAVAATAVIALLNSSSPTTDRPLEVVESAPVPPRPDVTRGVERSHSPRHQPTRRGL